MKRSETAQVGALVGLFTGLLSLQLCEIFGLKVSEEALSDTLQTVGKFVVAPAIAGGIAGGLNLRIFGRPFISRCKSGEDEDYELKKRI